MNALRVWACAIALLMASGAGAISGNEQVRLAGEGVFDQLAERLAAENEGPSMSAADRHALCYAFAKLKDYERLTTCLDALEAKHRSGDTRTRLFGLDDGRPTVFLMRAEAAIDLGNFAFARDEAARALAWFESEHSGDRDILVDALALTVLAEAMAGRTTQAEQSYAKLQAVDVSWPRYDAYAGAKRSAVARAAVALHRWSDVLDALAPRGSEKFHVFMDDLLSGASLRGKSNWVWQQLPRAYLVARATWETGRVQEAVVSYDKLLAVPEVALNGEIHWLALFDRGRLAEASGDASMAIRLYQTTVDVVERQRASITTETSKIGFVGQRQEVYTRLIQLLLQRHDVSAAYEYVERSKSRALVDMLASRVSTAQALGLDAARSASAQRFFETERVARYQRPQSNDGTPGTLRGSAPLQSAVADLREAAPQAASLIAVEWLSTRQLQALLEPDELLLQFYVQGAQGQVFAVSRKDVRVFHFDAAGLDGTVRRLRSEMQGQSKNAPDTLRRLYDLLLREPLQGASQKKLLIVPYGALHYLSFAALSAGDQQLVDRFALRMLPMATVLRYLARGSVRETQGALLLGNPDLGNPDHDLPNAQKEVETLGKTLPGALTLVRGAASETAFVEQAGRFRTIHVASHGIFDADHPLQSALMLAPDARRDGRLSAGELYGMHLDADLVTLSACETGVGQSMAGDEIVGLTRGFLYAGTSSIVASLWNVDDLATSFLMLRFYSELQNGRDKREALRAAQLETRKRFPHPFFWAPFFLVGQP